MNADDTGNQVGLVTARIRLHSAYNGESFCHSERIFKQGCSCFSLGHEPQQHVADFSRRTNVDGVACCGRRSEPFFGADAPLIRYGTMQLNSGWYGPLARSVGRPPPDSRAHGALTEW